MEPTPGTVYEVSTQPMAAQPTLVQEAVPAPVYEAVAETIVPVAPVPTGSLALFTGYANIGIGFVVLVILGMYFAGFGIWVTHLHVTHRDEGVEWMERAVTTLFWLLVLLGIMRFIQFYPRIAMQILAVAIVLIGGWFVIKAVQATSEGEDEH